ncbi:hypothetical protein JFK97_20420 [Chromobacterium phragmitis]|uniref:hypothetical protein n=1 Tax=Chromobacterium amazonense TaxID=1382803 RepID=UPI0021B81A3C|nr:hypothetical protein [Chromobacterium amazonense]MBM2886759.1 hypothetical protein [Chromobacterium amazonense]
MDDNKASDLARERVLRALKGEALDVEPVEPDPEAVRMENMLIWLSRKREFAVVTVTIVALYGFGASLGMFDGVSWSLWAVGGLVAAHVAVWAYASFRLARLIVHDEALPFARWVCTRWWDVFMFYYP